MEPLTKEDFNVFASGDKNDLVDQGELYTRKARKEVEVRIRFYRRLSTLPKWVRISFSTQNVQSYDVVYASRTQVVDAGEQVSCGRNPLLKYKARFFCRSVLYHCYW